MGPPTSHRQPPADSTPPGRRPDESMTLITSMMERPLDPGYAAAAQRRVAAGLPAATPTRSVTVLVAALVIGLLLTMSALSLRRPDAVPSRARAQLVAQIEAQRALADQRAAQVQTLQAEVDALQSGALDGSDDLAERLARLSLATGAEAVTGPGLRVTLDDAERGKEDSADGDPRTRGQQDDGRVLSRDLQFVTNGLWTAGAEAIAVNGQRLTARSAIRFAGEAILVNYRPLTRPYVIEAIGDPKRLEVEFAESSASSYLRALEDNYGVRVRMEQVERLTLPAASSLTVRNAGPVPTGGQQSPTTEPAQ